MSTMRNADNIKYYQNLSGMCYKNYLIKSPSAIDFKISIVRSLGRIGISIKSKIILLFLMDPAVVYLWLLDILCSDIKTSNYHL